jgi:WD40 repeat protein
VLTWSDDGTARIWDVGAANLPRLLDAGQATDWTSALSPEADPVEVRADPGGIRLHDLAGQSLTAALALTLAGANGATADGLRASLPQEMLPHAIVNGDRTLAVTWDGGDQARRWDAKSGEELSPPLVHERAIRGAVFSAEGARILTWSRDGTARVWDARSGKPSAPALRHRAPVNGARFSTDASRVLTWSNDGTARIWDADTGAALSPPFVHASGTLQGSRAVMDAHLDPNGVRVSTRDEGGTVRAWDLPLDRQWPVEMLDVRLEAETGTAMSASGELRVLSPTEWRRVRYCDYDRIRHELGRIDDAAWKESERRCEAAHADRDSKAGTLRSRSSTDWSGIRR